MKFNKILIVSVIMAAATVMVGCKRDEKDLFKRSAAERIQDAVDEISDFLTAAPNGWEMVYFPKPESAGYSMLLKFDNNDKVLVAGRNITTANAYKTDESAWEVIKDQGPVLTFNTYNSVLHAFSDPLRDGVGYEGDYEFVVIEKSAEYMRLKGKKHDGRIYMFRLGESTNWEDYFNQVESLNSELFAGNDGILLDWYSEDKLDTVEYASNVMYYMNSGDVLSGFCTRPGGIMFQFSLTEDDRTAVDFVLNEEKNALVCVDGVDMRFTAHYSVPEYFVFKIENRGHWIIDKDNLEGEALQAYNDFVNSVAASSSAAATYSVESFTYLKDADDKDVVAITYKRNNVTNYGYIFVNKSLENNQVTYTYSSADQNAEAIMRRSANNDINAGIAKLTKLALGTFNLESATGNSINISSINLIDASNANRRLRVNLE